MMKNKSAIVAYVPVLHDGYRRFFCKYKRADTLYILGDGLIEKFRPLVKDIRRLPPRVMKTLIKSLGIFKSVEILTVGGAKKLKRAAVDLVLPDEDVSRELAAEFFAGQKITFDSVFLRWDKRRTTAEQPIEAEQEISERDFDRQMMEKARAAGEKTSDWWRAVGALLVKDGRVILAAHNCHVPSEHAPYQNGDPRANFSQGINLELSTALHAEAGLVAEAARRGLALDGAEIYVTDFPCPPCAKLVAYSGIKKLYYRRGYNVLDNVSILKSQGVKIIWVK